MTQRGSSTLEQSSIAGRGTRAMAEVVARLLRIATEVAPESKTLGTAAFRASIETYRNRLAEQTHTPQRVREIASDAVDSCEQFFGRAEAYRAEREKEVRELIQMLHEALATMGGQSTSFHERLLATGDQLARLSELEDIRLLKQRLDEDVRALKQTVEERQLEEKRHFDELMHQVGTLESTLAVTKRKAETDGLTGIPNRASFDEAFVQWLSRHDSERSRFAAAMVDLDDFKKVNDEHGHQVGDRVLLCAARAIEGAIGSEDFVGRYGGEEFVVLLRVDRLKKARQQMEELVTRIAQAHYTYRQSGEEQSITFTVSVGVALYSPGEPGDELIGRADEALYEAKRRGKNRVETKKRALFQR